jgi:hypothetical protein
MTLLTAEALIRAIMWRRYPTACLMIQVKEKSGSELSEEEAEARALEGRLKTLELSKLHLMYEEELRQEAARWRVQGSADEAERSWNRPEARTDYDFWSKAASWTLDEATALSLGRDPHHVSWDSIKTCLQISSFARIYERQRELILRAKGIGQLYEPVIPSVFLAWAQRTGIELDLALVKVVEARGVQLADWKTLYDRMREVATKNEALADAERARGAMLKEQLEEQARMYKEMLEKTRAAHREQTAKWAVALEEAQKAIEVDKPLTTRERETLLTIVLGMAIGGYGYEPRASRSPTAREISDDLTKAGLSVSDDTIRKYLREAAELAPPAEAE